MNPFPQALQTRLRGSFDAQLHGVTAAAGGSAGLGVPSAASAHRRRGILVDVGASGDGTVMPWLLEGPRCVNASERLQPGRGTTANRRGGSRDLQAKDRALPAGVGAARGARAQRAGRESSLESTGAAASLASRISSRRAG